MSPYQSYNLVPTMLQWLQKMQKLCEIIFCKNRTLNYCENFKARKGLICSSMWKAISPFQVEHFYILMTTTKSQRNSSTAWIHIAGCQQQKSIMFPRFACQAVSNTDLIGQSDIAQDTFKNWLKLFHLYLNSAQWIYQCLKLGVLKNEIWRFSYQGCVNESSYLRKC